VKITFKDADVFTKALRAVSSAVRGPVHIHPNVTTDGVVQSVDMLSTDGQHIHGFRFQEHEFTTDAPAAAQYVLTIPTDGVQLLIASTPQSVTIDTSTGSLDVVASASVPKLHAVVTTVPLYRHRP
jgi:hypothetical protein